MPRQIGSHALREAEQQCLVRDANEAAELLNVDLIMETKRRDLRCECGDGACATAPHHPVHRVSSGSGTC